MGIPRDPQDLNVCDIPGLSYFREYLDPAEESDLVRAIDSAVWSTEMKRRVQHYGYRYDYRARNVSGLFLGPLPVWLSRVSGSLAGTGLFTVPPDQVIVNEYEPGQGITPHIDCVPCFGEVIASLSLLSGCVMEMIRPGGGVRVPVFLEPRSLLVLRGEARREWRHAIPPRKKDAYGGEVRPRGRRISLTFRTVLK